jgi:hypothetical protein
VVSELVETRRVWPPGVEGLTTASSSTLIWSCGCTVAKIEQVIVVPEGLQNPACWPFEVSVTVPAADPRPVPEGSVIVIWLPAEAERPPVEDVPNATRYTVRAPAAELSVETVGCVGWFAGGMV